MLPNVPALLLEKLNAQYGAALAEEIVAGFVRRPVTLRVNTIKSTVEAVAALLDKAGIAYERVPWYQDAFILRDVREEAIQAMPEYEAGHMYLQSLSSMMPPLVVAPGKNESILDMAAAPGGKTTQMAALSGNTALITACEKNKIRAERLQFNLHRLGETMLGMKPLPEEAPTLMVGLHMQFLLRHMLVNEYRPGKMESVYRYCEDPVFRQSLALGGQVSGQEGMLLEMIDNHREKELAAWLRKKKINTMIRKNAKWILRRLGLRR